MSNQFMNFLTILNSYSKQDILFQFVFSAFISLLYLIALNFIIKKTIITKSNRKQFFYCGFLISYIYNSIIPYLDCSLFSINIINFIFNILCMIAILSILLFIESQIIKPFVTDKKLINKFLLWQGISIPIYNIFANLVVFIIIITVSSFM